MARDCTEVGPNCPADSSSLSYPPNITASIIFTVIFAISLVGHSALGLKYKTWSFMSVYCTGSVLEVIGYVGRVMLRNNPYNLNTFLLQIICLTTAPAFYSAGLYLCLSRIVIVYGDGLSRIKPAMYTRFFIGCDIISLSLQGAGGGVASSSTTISTLSLGNNLMLAGLIFQIVTLAIFGLICLDFAVRVYRYPSKKNPTYDALRSSVRFQGFLGAVFVTFLTIFTRCVYRVVELGGGWNNSLQREEIPFIVLESVMIAICVFAFVAFHPGYGFQRNFNTLRYQPATGASSKEAISQWPSQQDQRSDPVHTGNKLYTNGPQTNLGYSHA